MEITGIMLALLDSPAEYTQEYNRWYDLDHMPEHVSKADIVMGRRYVADRSLRQAPETLAGDWSSGHPPYATVYFAGGPLDFMSEEARGGWTTMDHRIVREGRYWRKGVARHVSRWRLVDARARSSCLVAPPAIPHLAHRGVIVAAGRAPSPERVGEAIAWWDRVHLVDLLAVTGLLAAIRFDPVDDAHRGTVLHLLLCEHRPAEVMDGIARTIRYQSAVGRFPPHGGVYEPLAFLPYERIVPLEYDFDIGDPT